MRYTTSDTHYIQKTEINEIYNAGVLNICHVCLYMSSYLKSLYTDTFRCTSYVTKTIKSLYKFKLRINKFVCKFLIVGIPIHTCIVGEFDRR